jgi:hypothetical protein
MEEAMVEVARLFLKLADIFEDSPVPLATKVVSSYGLFGAGREPSG